jgi:hypothetical protein
MINVSGSTNVAQATSESPRIRVTHAALPVGVGLQARAHLLGDDTDVRAVTLDQTDTVLHASASGAAGERLVLIVEATGTGPLDVSEVIAGAGPEDDT